MWSTSFLPDPCSEGGTLPESRVRPQCPPRRALSRRLLPLAGLVSSVIITGTHVRPAQGQAPEVVKDLCSSYTLGSEPRDITAVGERSYFFALAPGFPSLWRSDGTASGTVPVTPLANFFTGHALGSVQGRFIFGALESELQLILWSSDGSATTALATLDLGWGSAWAVRAAVTAGDRMFFLLETGNVLDLWITDGSPAGTRRIKSVGTAGVPEVFLVQLGDGVLFPGDDGTHGVEPWRSDGTEEGTRMLLDLFPGASGSEPRSSPRARIDSTLYFVANDPTTGFQLHRTDGTAGGTRLVKALVTDGGTNQAPRDLTNLHGGRRFLATVSGRDRVWRTDGTAEGTRLVTSATSPTEILAVLPDKVVVLGSDPVHGSELWTTDGTSAGTTLVADIVPGSQGVSVSSRVTVGPRAYLALNDQVSGEEPWATDGTPGGTFLLQDLLPGPGGSFPSMFAGTGGVAYFSADTPQYGRELWRSAGTAASTWMVADINRATDSFTPIILFAANDRLYLVAKDCTEYGLWESDGTGAGTVLVKPLPRVAGAEWSDGVSSDLPRGLYLVAEEGLPGPGVWFTDLGPGAPQPLADVRPERGFFWANRKLYFTVPDGPFGSALWRSDGTSAGTSQITSTKDSGFSVVERSIAVVGSEIFFCGVDEQGPALWRTDGTPGGAVLIRRSGGDFFIDFQMITLVAFGGRAFLGGYAAAPRSEPWRTDGTAEGTNLLRDIYPGSDSSRMAGNARACHGRLYFTATDGVHGYELWTSDGTPDGTALLADIFPGPESSEPAGFREGPAGAVYFAASEYECGRELWRTDGSSGGTHRVADILSWPLLMVFGGAGTIAGTQLYFNFLPFDPFAPTAPQFVQSWVTDGSAAGTRRIPGRYPGSPWAQIGGGIEYRGCLYLSAFDAMHGAELNRLCPATPRPPRRRALHGSAVQPPHPSRNGQPK